MTRIKTSEEIREYLRKFKEEKMKEKQSQTFQKKDEIVSSKMKELYELRDKIEQIRQNKALQALKNTKPYQQSTEDEKCAQKALKCPQTESLKTDGRLKRHKLQKKDLYGTIFIERFTRGDFLWNTAEELMRVEGTEESGNGKINWDVMVKIINEGRKINGITEEFKI